MSFPRGQCAIVGAATFGMGESPGFTALELASRASVLALKQAGLTPAQVDGVFGCMTSSNFCGLSLAEYLGIAPKLTNNNKIGGSSFQTHVLWATLALSAGLIDVALIAYGSNLRSGAVNLSGNMQAQSSPYEAPYEALRPVSAYAMAAARHMHEYGTTREQLAHVAVSARQWAQRNPDAFMRDPLSVQDVLASRRVSDPLTVRDCCLMTDGAGAIVLTRADRARDLCATPVHVLGAAEAMGHKDISSSTNLTTTAAAQSGARAYAQAGVGAADVDVVQLYDAFTINTLLFLEDLGFCPKGEGGRFVADGHIAPGGSLPVNTNGGGLSCVHPGMYGMFTLIEASQQLMGLAGARQVPGAQLALAHGNGIELSSQATVILGTAATL